MTRVTRSASRNVRGLLMPEVVAVISVLLPELVMHSILQTAATAAFVLWASGLAVAWAESPTEPPPTGGDFEPSGEGIGERIAISSDRYINIHRQAENKGIGPVRHYYHRPLFILKTNPKPIEGFPSIVLDAPRKSEGKTFITIGLITTTKYFQELARAFVIKNDDELKQPGVQASLNQIKVHSWPIKTLIVKLVDPFSDEMLGEWMSQPLTAAPPTIRVPIGLSDQNLERFMKYAHDGTLEFRFSYIWKNKRQDYAVAISAASREINKAFEQSIASLNLTSSSQVFQSQANQLRSVLADKLATAVVATNTALIPLVQSKLLDQVLTSETVDITRISDEKLLDAIYGYLKPLLETTQRNTTTTDKETKTTENNIKMSLNAPTGGAATFNVSPEVMNKIENAHEVKFTYDATKQSYVPVSIKVYKLSSLSDERTTQIVTRAFLVQGGNNNLEEDTPIPSNFTDKLVDMGEQSQKASNFDGMLPGMAFCYFGSEIPTGYLEISPENKWPDAAWVPPKLKGKFMPLSHDSLIGITRFNNEVGTVWNSGVIDIGSIDVPADGLNVQQAHDDSQHLMLAPEQKILDDCEHFFDIPHPPCQKIRDAAQRNSLSVLGAGSHTNDIVLSRTVPGLKLNGIAGSAKAKVPPVALTSRATLPKNIRCRLIVKE